MTARHNETVKINNSKSSTNETILLADVASDKNRTNNSTTTTTKTTRVCIKGLPPNCNESALRKHLMNTSSSSSKSVVITDCKVLKTKDGKSRKIAFVGLKTSEMAEDVVSYFHRSYYGTSKLIVEKAFNKGSSAVAVGGSGDSGSSSNKNQTTYRPWSKYSVGSSKYNALHQNKNSKKKNDDDNDEKESEKHVKNDLDKKRKDNQVVIDRKKEEFLQLMMNGKKSGKVWGNDDGVDVTTAADSETNTINEKKNKKEAVVENDDSDDDDESSDDGESSDDELDIEDSFKKNKKVIGTAMSDMDFLRSKVKTDVENLSDDDNELDDSEKDEHESSKKKGDDDDDDDDSTVSSSSSSAASSSAASSSSSEDTLNSDKDKKEIIPVQIDTYDNNNNAKAAASSSSQTSKGNDSNEGLIVTERLFVRNLPFSATEEELKEVFEPFGDIIECHIPVDDTLRNKGYAFVKFTSSDDAATAKEQLDGSQFQGRLMHVLPAKPERDVSNGLGEGESDNMTHKQKMEVARQKEAINTTTGLSTNFVRGDAVVDNLADRFGLDKGSVFNVKDGLSSGNAAVRLALGETQILEENREYFRKHGIQMDALVSSSANNGPGKRSTKMILVKNLPFDTCHDDLAKLFLPYSSNANILLPPSKTIALVEYAHANEAKKAFRKLAYKRFKQVPLYLEMAPLCAKVETSSATSHTPLSTSQIEANENDIDEQQEDDLLEEGGSTSIYVKNLNFRTTEETLKTIFEESIDKVRSVRIPTKAAPIKSNKKQLLENNDLVQYQSMGYGFVECYTETYAQKAIKALQGKIVDGHAIELKLSTKSSGTRKPPMASKKNSTKIMVRNVPFQATRTEILQLFGSFGQLKTVRLPRKFDGDHRGFAFVEFTSIKEAENAMKTLSQTHLYGRHLVLEWADDKDDIETLRGKAKRDSSSTGMTSDAQTHRKNKKIRFD